MFQYSVLYMVKIYLVYSLFTIVLPIRHIVICLKSLVLSFYSNRVCLSNPLLILGMYMIPARLFRVRSKRELLFMSPSPTHWNATLLQQLNAFELQKMILRRFYGFNFCNPVSRHARTIHEKTKIYSVVKKIW